MRLRLLASPVWIRWTFVTCLFAITIALVATLAAPRLLHALPWPWPVGLLAGTSVALGGLWAVATQPQHRLCLEVLQGVSNEDRHRVVNAIRQGDVPDDPAVLGAAIRLSRLSVPRPGLAKRQLVFGVVAVVAWVAIAVFDFVIGDLRQGVLWLAVAVMFSAASGWDRQRRRRVQRNVQALRAAAAQSPGESAFADAQSDKLETSLRRATRVWAVGAVVILAGALSLTYVLVRTNPDCLVGRDVIFYLNDRKTMMDANLLTPAGPPLREYQVWSDQLREYASKVSDDAVARHVERIAELATQAVSVVHDSRTDPAGAAAADQLQRRAAYLVLMKGITDEMWAIVDVCRLR
ncbi:MAG: hypothetical protein QOH57_4668 [Mycobacterium sp.]|nr:hypothetical protein [Mycobacterium sp.]